MVNLSIINMRKLHIKYGDMQMKEYFKVKYLESYWMKQCLGKLWHLTL